MENKLLEVVEAMANFDGRNNNAHLKEMARLALLDFAVPAPNPTLPGYADAMTLEHCEGALMMGNATASEQIAAARHIDRLQRELYTSLDNNAKLAVTNVKLKELKQQTAEQFNAENGPMHMGEPVLPPRINYDIVFSLCEEYKADFNKTAAIVSRYIEQIKLTKISNEGGKSSLLREALNKAPPGCYCKPGKCAAPKGMSCRDLTKKNAKPE